MSPQHLDFIIKDLPSENDGNRNGNCGKYFFQGRKVNRNQKAKLVKKMKQLAPVLNEETLELYLPSDVSDVADAQESSPRLPSPTPRPQEPISPMEKESFLRHLSQSPLLLTTKEPFQHTDGQYPQDPRLREPSLPKKPDFSISCRSTSPSRPTEANALPIIRRRHPQDPRLRAPNLPRKPDVPGRRPSRQISSEL